MLSIAENMLLVANVLNLLSEVKPHRYRRRGSNFKTICCVARGSMFPDDELEASDVSLEDLAKDWKYT